MQNPYDTHVATPIYGAGSVFYITAYADRGKLYRLRHAGPDVSAEYVWTSPFDNVTGSGVLVDGVLYSSGYSRPRHWFAIDWQTGRTRAEIENLTSGAAIWADGRLYCLEQNGTMNLLTIRPRGLEACGPVPPRRATGARRVGSPGTA